MIHVTPAMFSALSKHANRVRGMRVAVPKHITNMIAVQTPEGGNLISAGLIFHNDGKHTLLLSARTALGQYLVDEMRSTIEEQDTAVFVEPDGVGGGKIHVRRRGEPTASHTVKRR